MKAVTPKVTLVSHTQDALDLLLFTKQTRLKMSPNAMDEIRSWDEAKKMAELDYMLGTIQSSWEFVDYVFCIENVSRAFTHQLVRHRVGTSFAQQAQRAVDMEGFDYVMGPSISANENMKKEYHNDMEIISAFYSDLKEDGANKQDARGVLPTNIATNIVYKVNLRGLHDQMLKRLCVKAQGEAQDVYRLMREEVIKVHPWARKFLKVWCAFYGTCCFPTFPMDQCPAKPWVYDPVERNAYKGFGYIAKSLAEIEDIWELNRAEAQPKV